MVICDSIFFFFELDFNLTNCCFCLLLNSDAPCCCLYFLQGNSDDRLQIHASPKIKISITTATKVTANELGKKVLASLFKINLENYSQRCAEINQQFSLTPSAG